MTVKFENITAVSVAWVQPEMLNGDIIEYEVIYYGLKPKVLLASAYETSKVV